MSERYDFGNLSPIEFEALCIDLVSTETGLRFESFAAGPDGGIDGRHSSTDCRAILQAKHYKNSSWSDLQKTAKKERDNLEKLAPNLYYFTTSQGLTPARKNTLKGCLDYKAVDVGNIWGRTELNALLQLHGEVEKRNIKLWISSSSVLERLLNNDIAVFTEGTRDEIERILKVYVTNPSLGQAAQILNNKHCVIISGPPGVGKTTLAQVLATEYCDDDWELVAISSIDAGLKEFKDNKKQVFIFDDFLGKIKLDEQSIAKDDGKIARFFNMVGRRSDKRFILTTRAYIFQAARNVSEELDTKHIEVSELVLDLSTYTREIKARILYNHLYHSDIPEDVIQALFQENTIQRIVDHRNYMPRIIEWMTDYYRNKNISPKEYPKQFLNMLDDPSKIWEKAFFKHISPAAQILLYCMYFSKLEYFPKDGFMVDSLKSFFEMAIVKFGAIQSSQLRESIFEEVLREVKSSFIVIDGEIVNFINPSVQDFLSNAVNDKHVSLNLASSVNTFESAKQLWSAVKRNFNDAIDTKKRIAAKLLEHVASGEIQGHAPLHDVIEFLGDLVISTGQVEYIDVFREKGVPISTWVEKTELPQLIDELAEGRFNDLKYAQAFARLLRMELYTYLADREYILEIEELGTLADNIVNSFYEYSDDFHENFCEAAREAVDSLDIGSLSHDEDHEGTVGEWIENIEKIERYTPDAVSYWKKQELEEYMHNLAMQHEEQMARYKDKPSLKRSSSSGKDALFSSSTGSSITQFSDSDISAMFSSLKK